MQEAPLTQFFHACLQREVPQLGEYVMGNAFRVSVGFGNELEISVCQTKEDVDIFTRLLDLNGKVKEDVFGGAMARAPVREETTLDVIISLIRMLRAYYGWSECRREMHSEMKTLIISRL